MISARIIEISDKVKVKYYKLPKVSIYYDLIEYHKYRDSRTIAEVENILHYHNLYKKDHMSHKVYYYDNNGVVNWKKLKLNQQVFIELTKNGKCKIVKICL